MYEAYNNNRDLYAIIAQSAFHNDYWDNLEFYKEFTELEVDGKTIVAGSGKEYSLQSDDQNSIIVPWCYLVPTDHGELAAEAVQLTDKLITETGPVAIGKIEPVQEADSDIKKIRFFLNLN